MSPYSNIKKNTINIDKSLIDHFRREPNNPRTSMESSEMEPDDARQFIRELMRGIHNRMNEMPKERFEKINGNGVGTPTGERAKQHYGNDTYQFFSGIQAALREWDSSGTNTKELKEEYGGEFVRGVEIGERLAVYEGSDFTFTGGNDDFDDESPSASEKFTFTQ